MHMDIAMTTYNRADVLEKSLKSLANTNTNNTVNLYIFDDCSTDPRVEKLVMNFIEETRGKFLVFFKKNASNVGCDMNMCDVISYAFDHSKNQFVITTDSDVIYNRDWLMFMDMALMEMSQHDNIAAISAYDSISHLVHSNYNSWLSVKRSIGGLCAMLNRNVFEQIKTRTSWDWEFVKICREKKYLLLCAKQSLIQHIGQVGAHSPDGNLYDISNTFVGE